MTGALLSTCVALDELPALDAAGLDAALSSARDAGERLVTLYGRRDADALVVTLASVDAQGALRVARARLDAGTPLRSVTPALEAAHVFERELREQTGAGVVGHPWLKPLRSEDGRMGGYEHYGLDGKEVFEVAVGPVHAGIIEPGSFRFSCHGEVVQHLEIQLGYQHRGAEALCVGRRPEHVPHLIETVSGDSSVAHAWAYAAAIEALSGVEVPDEVDDARATMLELERVGAHLATLAGLAGDVGHLQGATTYGRLRTTAINLSMRLCGSRFGRGAVRPGGARVGALDDETRAALAVLTRDHELIDRAFFGALSAQHRLRGVGVLTRDAATSLGVVGLAARASGLELDARPRDRGPWARAPIDRPVRGEGDCWARGRLRGDELRASLRWLSRRADGRPRAVDERRPTAPLAPRRLSIAMVEGQRGELVHAVETGDDGRVVHHKLQDPSLRNWMGLALSVRGEEISDFPMCNKSFDLSYAGHDL